MAGTFVSLPGEVNSINGLQGDVTIVAGTNVTITSTGQVITVSATGGGGGTPGGSTTQVQYNNAGAFAGSSNFTFDGTTVTLPSETINGKITQAFQVSSNITIANRTISAPTAPIVSFTATSGFTIGGIDPTGVATGRTVTLFNNTSANITVKEEDGTVPAINRILNMGQGDITLYPRGMVTLVYGTFFTASRWMIQQPAGVMTNGTQSFGGQKTFTNALFANGGLTVNVGDLSVNTTTHTHDLDAYHVQVNGYLTSPLATITEVDAGYVDAAATPISTGSPSALIASLVPAATLSSPTASTSQSTPHIQRPSFATAVINYGESGWVALGQTFEYQVWAINAGGQACVVSADSPPVSDDGSLNPFAVDLSWDDSQPGSLDFIDHYLVGRQLNGSGGFSYQAVGLSTSIVDDNSYPFADSLPGFAPDYIANNTMRQYYATNFALSPGSSTTYYSNAFSYTFTDDNSGNAFLVQHSYSGSILSGQGRILGDDFGTALAHRDVGGDWVEAPGDWTVGAVITPTDYGILSDGTALNLDFQVYGKQVIGSNTIYSASHADGTTVDPNDGFTYTVNLSWTAGSGNSGYKILESTDAGSTYPNAKVRTPTSYIIDAFSSWPDSTTTTPTSSATTAITAESTATGSSDPAQLIVKSSLGTYTRIDFKNYVDFTMASMTVTGGGIGFADMTGLGFFGAAPWSQSAGGTHSAGATYTANEQTMLQILWTMAKNYGLIS